MKNNETRPSHTENLTRLNRIVGQVEGVKKMIVDGRDCSDILTQLRAIRSAVKAVESRVLQTHLQHCVAQSFTSDIDRNAQIAELKRLFDKYGD